MAQSVGFAARDDFIGLWRNKNPMSPMRFIRISRVDDPLQTLRATISGYTPGEITTYGGASGDPVHHVVGNLETFRLLGDGTPDDRNHLDVYLGRLLDTGSDPDQFDVIRTVDVNVINDAFNYGVFERFERFVFSWGVVVVVLESDISFMWVWPVQSEIDIIPAVAETRSDSAAIMFFYAPKGLALKPGFLRFETSQKLKKYLMRKYLKWLLSDLDPQAPLRSPMLPANFPGGTQPSTCREYDAKAMGPPRLIRSMPPSAAAGEPVVLVGRNFTRGAVPLFSGSPASPVLQSRGIEVPPFGQLTVGLAFVPDYAAPGPNVLQVQYCEQLSPAIDFYVKPH
jgi:hypothetical protein